VFFASGSKLRDRGILISERSPLGHKLERVSLDWRPLCSSYPQWASHCLLPTDPDFVGGVGGAIEGANRLSISRDLAPRSTLPIHEFQKNLISRWISSFCNAWKVHFHPVTLHTMSTAPNDSNGQLSTYTRAQSKRMEAKTSGNKGRDTRIPFCLVRRKCLKHAGPQLVAPG
jgi:hypothetical protein